MLVGERGSRYCGSGDWRRFIPTVGRILGDRIGCWFRRCFGFGWCLGVRACAASDRPGAEPINGLTEEELGLLSVGPGIIVGEVADDGVPWSLPGWSTYCTDDRDKRRHPMRSHQQERYGREPDGGTELDERISDRDRAATRAATAAQCDPTHNRDQFVRP